MAGSLVFGLVNHFVFVSPDHVAHVDPQWRPLFATTAVLLAGPKRSAPGWRSVSSEKGSRHECLRRGWIRGHWHSPRTRPRRRGPSGQCADALDEQTGRAARAGRFRSGRRRAGSSGSHRRGRGGPSDTRDSSIDCPSQGRTAPAARSRGDEPPAHRRHAKSARRSHQCWRPTIHRRLVCHAVRARPRIRHDGRCWRCSRSLDGDPGARRDNARVDRRRRPSLRHVLWSRNGVNRRNDRHGAETTAAGRPRRCGPAAADPSRRCGERDRARARSGARRQRVRHRGRSRGEHDRDRRGDREYSGSAAPFRVPAWLPRLVAPTWRADVSFGCRCRTPERRRSLAGGRSIRRCATVSRRCFSTRLER